MIKEMKHQNGIGIKKAYHATYHKNDINLDSKPKYKNIIKIVGSTASNNKSTGIDNKKATSNYAIKPEIKSYNRKIATTTTTNAINAGSRKSNVRAPSTSKVKVNNNNNTKSNATYSQTSSIRRDYKRTIATVNNNKIDYQKKNSNQFDTTKRLSSKPNFDTSFKNDKKIIDKENYNITEEYLCFRCQEKTFIKLDPVNLKVNLECRNGHSSNIDIAEFKTKNENNNKKIICSGCRNKDIRPKNLYYCSCGKTICHECKKNHKNHEMIQFYLKYNNCLKHKKEYTHFCQKCNKNICDECFNEHKNHKNSILKFDSILPNNGIVSCKDYLEKKRKRNIELKNKVENYFAKLEEKKNIFIQNLEQFLQMENDITAKVKNPKINNYEDIKNFEYLKSSIYENPNINEFLKIKNDFVKEGQFLIKLIGGEDFDLEEKEKEKEKEKDQKIKDFLKQMNILQSQSIIKKSKKERKQIYIDKLRKDAEERKKEEEKRMDKLMGLA